MARGRKANPDEIRKTKAYGRQSKNIEDFRDTVAGPKKFSGKTRRVQAENTRGKLDEVVMNNGGMTQDKKISDVTPSPETTAYNMGMNRNRTNYGTMVGQILKNRNLGTPPTNFQFLKHTIKTKKGKK